MGCVVTQEQIDLADDRGACGEAMGQIEVGLPVNELDQYMLIWAEDEISDQATAVAEALAADEPCIVRGQPPLALLADSGYGYGYGYGSGDGSGYGSGYGYGYGDGSGYGYGYGYGYGSSQ